MRDDLRDAVFGLQRQNTTDRLSHPHRISPPWVCVVNPQDSYKHKLAVKYDIIKGCGFFFFFLWGVYELFTGNSSQNFSLSSCCHPCFIRSSPSLLFFPSSTAALFRFFSIYHIFFFALFFFLTATLWDQLHSYGGKISQLKKKNK